MIKNGFTLTTKPIKIWLGGCGCKDLEYYYHNECDLKRQEIIEKLYRQYKRLNLADVECIMLFSISEDRNFVLDRNKHKKKIKELAEMQEEKEMREKIRIYEQR